MELEYGLVENALDSLREAMNYYNEGDEEDNANQYKFSILLSAHCVELLLKEILRRNHPALLFENIDSVNIQKIGAEFENHPAFPDRINTEFVQPISASHIKMRVWERGAGETLSCGTGACAAAVACILNGYCKRDTDIKISLRGGELSVKWSADGDVYLTGSAQTVFTGEIAYGGGAK